MLKKLPILYVRRGIIRSQIFLVGNSSCEEKNATFSVCSRSRLGVSSKAFFEFFDDFINIFEKTLKLGSDSKRL